MDDVSRRDPHGRDGPRDFAEYRDFHLHRFQQHQFVAYLDLLANLDLNLCDVGDEVGDNFLDGHPPMMPPRRATGAYEAPLRAAMRRTDDIRPAVVDRSRSTVTEP